MGLTASPRLAVFAIWLIPALWSLNYLGARLSPGVVQPHTLALGRWLIVAGVLGFFCRKELWLHRSQIRQQWRQYLALGFAGMVACGAWVYAAARTSPAMNIALIYACSPVLISAGAAFWLHERLRWWQMTGFALAIAGVGHVVVKGQWLTLSQVQWVSGDFLVLLAAICWAVFALLQKHWPSPLSAFARLAVMSLAGCVLLLPFVAWECSQPDKPKWSWLATELVLLVGLLPGIFAYTLYGWAQTVLGASRVGMAMYLAPLWAAVVSRVFLAEPLGWHHLVGALLILPGVALVQRSEKVDNHQSAIPDTTWLKPPST